MPATESVSRLAPYVQEALENREVQDQIRRGSERLRSAYQRSRKQRIKAARDAKVRRQVREGTLALGLAAKTLALGGRPTAIRGDGGSFSFSRLAPPAPRLRLS